MLKEFEAVFATPVGLPPNRGHEHQIQHKEGAQAIVQRPSFYQKNEIEKIVKKLLSLGSIWHNCSPFASPVQKFFWLGRLMVHGECVLTIEL